LEAGEGIDWAYAESLAFGTLLTEGHGVRLSGQDVRRGTFSQRHSVFYDSQTRERHIPLNNLSAEQGRYCVYNSLLSEAAVLGFDYGYSLLTSNLLVCWEAQFGDFVNGAQVIIDQFIASAESKWQRPSHMTLLLPHGYEGQGPEHSSARLERFLQLCAGGNMQVCNFTTPAQYFHALRRQLKRSTRKPLVVMTPKSLLRHPKCVSKLSDMAEGTTFKEVLDDEHLHGPARAHHAPHSVQRQGVLRPARIPRGAQDQERRHHPHRAALPAELRDAEGDRGQISAGAEKVDLVPGGAAQHGRLLLHPSASRRTLQPQGALRRPRAQFQPRRRIEGHPQLEQENLVEAAFNAVIHAFQDFPPTPRHALRHQNPRTRRIRRRRPDRQMALQRRRLRQESATSCSRSKPTRSPLKSPLKPAVRCTSANRPVTMSKSALWLARSMKACAAPAAKAEAPKPAPAGETRTEAGKAENVTEFKVVPKPEPAAAPVAAKLPLHPEGRVTRKKMSPLRKKIADQLVSAQRTAAILTTFNECDMSNVMALRSKLQDSFVAKNGVKLGFMSFFIKAVVEALKAVPQVNVRVEGDEIVQQHFFDIGVAVGTERGLIVPVLRDADQKSFAELEKDILAYAAKAKEGKIQVSDLTGGVFTISNGGVYGSLLSTPIINPPQSAILGMHSIQQRPVAVDGQVVIRPMMYLALSYDHRVVDGKEAVSFLIRVKDCIENPARMLVGA
jgi:2-oxoglutarate dehydrogenase E2 component (dihydrolipoamide succinyltransferase)